MLCGESADKLVHYYTLLRRYILATATYSGLTTEFVVVSIVCIKYINSMWWKFGFGNHVRTLAHFVCVLSKDTFAETWYFGNCDLLWFDLAT